MDSSDIDVNVKEKAIQELLGLLDQVLATPETISKTLVRHQLSEPERIKLLNWIDMVITEIPQTIKRLTNELENAETLRQTLQSSLHKIPDDSLIKPILEELNQHYQRLGELEAIYGEQGKKSRT